MDSYIVFLFIIFCIGVTLYEMDSASSKPHLAVGSLIMRIALVTGVVLYSNLEDKYYYALLIALADPRFLTEAARSILSGLKEIAEVRTRRSKGRGRNSKVKGEPEHDK